MSLGLPLDFGRPLLLLLVPVALAYLWLVARVSLAGQSPRWWRFGLLLRALIVLLLSLGLADLHLARKGEGLTVFYLLDRSASIPAQLGEDLLRRMSSHTEHQRRRDRSGLIVFGRDAGVDRDASQRFEPGAIDTVVDRDGTDIAGALRLAGAAFLSNRATGGRRVIIISDGNANRGDELLEARNLAQAGVVVDVLPIRYRYPNEVLVDSLVVPPEVHPEEPFDVSVIVHAEVEASGRVVLYENETRIAERAVEVLPGKTRVVFPLQRQSAERFRYEARLFLDDPRRDTIARNNVAYGSTVIRGASSVLFVGDEDEHTGFIAGLRAAQVGVQAVEPRALPQNSEDYFFYDAIVLADVAAYELGVDNMKLLHGVVKSLGVGLLMLGGPDSFGAGGYKGTPIEKLLPVEMEVKQRKTIPNGALVIVLHTCEFVQGNMWAKRIAIKALEALTGEDYFGVLEWSGRGQDSWGVPLQEADDKDRIATLIRAMSPSDMPSFDPSMRLAYQALKNASAVQKHMIIISDGDPIMPSKQVLDALVADRISVTTICIKPHSGRDTGLMKTISKRTGGRYYLVQDPRRLPGIFMREALHVRRSLIDEETFTPALTMETPPLRGLGGEGFPPLHGYVITTPKALADVPLVSHAPHHDPILAHWRYGLARTAAFTSDANGRWSKDWIGWPGFEPLMAQLVRYISKKGGGELLRVERAVEGDIGTISVDAIDPDGRYIDDLEISGSLLDPKFDGQPISFQQVGPGRYQARFDARHTGSYLLSLRYRDANGIEGHHQTGLSISYSPEYRQLTSDGERLERVARATGGRVLDANGDPFDRNLPFQVHRSPLWESLLYWATILFFVDVLCRRVLLSFAPVRRAVAWVRGRRVRAGEESTLTMTALLERRQTVQRERERRRALVATLDQSATAQGSSGAVETAPAAATEPEREVVDPSDEAAPSSFTDRLLDAKRRARRKLDD